MMKHALCLCLLGLFVANWALCQESPIKGLIGRIEALERRVKALETENTRLKDQIAKEKTRVMVKRGEYIGDGTPSRLIKLGFKPNLVLWHLKTDDSGIINGVKAGFCLSEHNAMGIAQTTGTRYFSNDSSVYANIVADGFVVGSDNNPNGLYLGGANTKDAVYVYVAVK